MIFILTIGVFEGKSIPLISKVHHITLFQKVNIGPTACILTKTVYMEKLRIKKKECNHNKSLVYSTNLCLPISNNAIL